MLPLEKIYLAQENKKLYAFCVPGNEKSIRYVFSMLKMQPENQVFYRALLDGFTFADHLLAYHNEELMS